MHFRPLSDFSGDRYSQFGEDGIISEILDRIEATRPLTGWCVEFGAHDGVFMSNTCNLVRSRDYSAVMIEADPKRMVQLAANYPQPEVIKINAMVGFDGDTLLDRILATTPIPNEFDVLSIDIDGCDYWILDSIENYRPSVLLVEFNPTIPNAVEFVQPRDVRVNQGSSPLSLLQLAKSKGYALAAVTTANLLLVRTDLLHAVIGPEVEPLTLEDLRDDSECVTYVFAGFDGTMLFSTPRVDFPWDNIAVDMTRVQPIPKFWRSFSSQWPHRSLRSQTWRIFKRLSRRIS